MTIYFIRAGDSGNIKIGYTSGSAQNRMRQLQTGNIFDLELLGTIPGEMRDEKSMHEVLSDYSLRGEWFRPDPEFIELVNKMIDGQLPWYHCREIDLGRAKTRKMFVEWVSAFSLQSGTDRSAYDEEQIATGGAVALVKKAIYSKRQFSIALSEIQKYKRENGHKPEWAEGIRKSFGKIFKEIKSSEFYRAARYILAWESPESIPL